MLETEITGTIMLNNLELDKCYYAFQFNNDEPVIFAHSSGLLENKLVITIDRNENGDLIFYGADNQTFKIFVKKDEN